MNDSQTLELQLKASIESANEKMNKLIDSISTVDTKINKAKESASGFSKAFSFGTAYLGLKKLTNQAMNWMSYSTDFTEALNLFNVIFKNVEKNGTIMYSRLGQQATKFQYKLNEAFGTNKTMTLEYQGLFQSMGENVGIDSKHAAIMSESMTKFTYDLASLYNKSEKNTAEALRAGVYAGQTKPLRSFGIDVTQQSMQPILGQLGIDKTVKELSQAEKEILRYIATLNQAKVAMGDFANTIESPANQLKIFKQQLMEAKVALTSLFIGGFSAILPYANAILMVVKEVAKAIASFFGIRLKDYNTGISSAIGGVSDGMDSIGDSAGGATKKAKELKREILSFDQIHNINENNNGGSSGGGSGGGVSGGIDQRLLDAIKGYDNGMDKVRMKANEIRDKIMEWLGFHKKINPLTGETYFEYEGISKTLKNMWNSFKKLSLEGKVLVGLGLVAGATKLWNIGKKLVTVFGNSGLGKALNLMLIPFKTLGLNMLNLIQYTKVYTSLTGNLKNGIIGGIEAWRQQNIIVKDSYGNIDKFKTAMSGAKVAVQGLITGAVGLYSVHQSMKSLSTEGANLANVFGLVSGSFMTIASGVQIGAIFGPTGAIIGGVAAALLTLVAAMKGYQDETDKMIAKDKKKSESLKEFLNSLKEERNAIQENLNANLSMTHAHTVLITELESIVDANGKVKKGYEERAEYILGTLSAAYDLEYTMTDGQISNYETLIGKIKQTIEAKNAEILADANREQYAKDLAKETELWAKKTEAVKTHQKYSKDLADAEKELADAEAIMNAYMQAGLPILPEMRSRRREAADAVKKLTAAEKEWAELEKKYTDDYEQNISRQIRYSNLQESIMTGNYEEIKKAVKEFTGSYVEDGKTVQLSLSERITKEQETANIILDVYKQKYGNDIPKELKNSAQASLNEVINGLTAQTNEVKNGKISKELAEAWHTLGKTDKDKFLEEFQKLDPEIQQKVVDKMYDKGYKISNELQRGIKSQNPKIDIKTKVQNATVKIDADTSKAEKKTNNWLKTLINAIPILNIGGKADGGILINGKWNNIAAYAGGGTPPSGQVFIAREAGPELVGKIGNHTAVMNNGQIVDSVRAGVYEAVLTAMSQSGGQASQIDVHVHTDEGTIVDRINQTTRQTGVCPIRI